MHRRGRAGVAPVYRNCRSYREESTPKSPSAVPPAAAWTGAAWREYFEERLAVAMINGQQSAAEARAIAWEHCVVRWMDLHTAATSPASCAHCGRPDAPGAVIVPYGTGPHAWLHTRCWRPWFTARRAEAEAALAGIRDDDD